jgi:hypothetical protein
MVNAQRFFKPDNNTTWSDYQPPNRRGLNNQHTTVTGGWHTSTTIFQINTDNVHNNDDAEIGIDIVRPSAY